jgi:hypothetical protein
MVLSVVGFGGTTDVYYYARRGSLVAFSYNTHQKPSKTIKLNINVKF